MPTLIMTFLGACWYGTVVAAYGGPLWQIPVELIFIAPFAVVLRSMRSGVYADKERLRIRSLRRTRTVLLTDVSALTSAPRRGDAHGPLRSDVLHVVLKSGETIRTPLRIRNPGEGRTLAGAVYDRDEYVRIKDHLGALVHNRMVDTAGPRGDQAG